jgi:hypothetical protein
VKYQAIAIVTLPAGALVKMAADQMRRRRHLVKPAKDDGWCEVTADFQFKVGEVFETDHGMSKAIATAIEEKPAPTAQAQAAPAATPTAEAAAKPAPAKTFAKR